MSRPSASPRRSPFRARRARESLHSFRFSADHFKEEEEGEGGGDLLVAVVRVWV